jgi:hypothetical protein
MRQLNNWLKYLLAAGAFTVAGGLWRMAIKALESRQAIMSRRPRPNIRRQVLR